MLKAETTCLTTLILKVTSPNTILCLNHSTDVKIEEPYNWYRAALRNLIHVTSLHQQIPCIKASNFLKTTFVLKLNFIKTYNLPLSIV